jgi:hypothetical protein
MKRQLTIGLLLVLLALVSTAGFAERIGRVVGVEAGYGYLSSTRGLNPQGSSALLASLYYGYLLGDKPSSQTLLSLALGYSWVPAVAAGEDLHRLVYGLEYAHTFFAARPVALVLNYGLLFNLLLQSGRQGYAFGHHTRLGLGPAFALGPRNRLLLNLAYEFVTFPYFEQASTSFSYASLSLRLMHRL